VETINIVPFDLEAMWRLLSKVTQPIRRKCGRLVAISYAPCTACRKDTRYCMYVRESPSPEIGSKNYRLHEKFNPHAEPVFRFYALCAGVDPKIMKTKMKTTYRSNKMTRLLRMK
jgi:hypothetical protein